MTLTFELDLDIVKKNQRADYLGRFVRKLLPHTRTFDRLFYLDH